MRRIAPAVSSVATALCLLGLAACSGASDEATGAAGPAGDLVEATGDPGAGEAADEQGSDQDADQDDQDGDQDVAEGSSRDADQDDEDGESGSLPTSGGTTGESGDGAPEAPAGEPDPGPAAAAMVLAPGDTAYLTLTDWARIKERLGASDLTSESIQTDRIEFWRGVGGSTVLLTDGVLRAENSRLGIRYAVTQDDALWEVRWTDRGQERLQGLALRLREDVDLSGLEQAVADEVTGLEGATVMPGQHLLLRDAAEGAVLGAAPSVAAGLTGDAETELVVPGCLSWPTALGVDATVQEQEAVVSGAAIEDLLDPAAWGMAFTGREATVTVVYPEGTGTQDASADAAARLALAEAWPTTESIGWADAFGLPPGLTGEGYAVSERGGQVVATLDYRVVNTMAAATVALAGMVPHAVCANIDWLAEPTGL